MNVRRAALFFAVMGAVLGVVTPAYAPFLIPIIGALAFAGISAAVAGTSIAMALIGAGLSVALNFAAQALMKPAGGGPTMTDVSMGSNGIAIEQKQSLMQATAPTRRIVGTTRIGGVIGVAHTTDQNTNLFLTYLWAGHKCNRIRETWIDNVTLTFDGDNTVADGRYQGVLHRIEHTGDIPQEPDYMLMTSIPDIWSAQHRGDGICYSAVRLYWDNFTGDFTIGQKIWQGDIPNITAVVEGALVYDPRSETTVFTSNPALHLAAYLCDDLDGLAYDYAEEIDEAALIVAANICDELVPNANGSNNFRYEANGYWKTDAKPNDIVGRLLGAMQGNLIDVNGKWVIKAGAWDEPTITITDDDMVEKSQLSSVLSERDSFNAVKGTFVDHTQYWTGTDFPSVASDFFKAQDGGQEKFDDIELPFTIHRPVASRIAKIHLFRNRQEIVETFIGKVGLWNVVTGSTVFRDSALYGWTQKPFEVTSVKIVKAEDENGQWFLCLRIQLQETAEAIWDWTTDEESPFDLAPNTNFPSTFSVAPPSDLVITEVLYVLLAGDGVKAKLILNWTESQDAFVRAGGHYVVRYREVGVENWTYLAPTKMPQAEILDLVQQQLEIQVIAYNWAGNPSEPLTVLRFVSALGPPPEAPSGLTIGKSANGTLAMARWSISQNPVLLQGGQIYFRFSPTLFDPEWASSVSLSDPFPANSGQCLLPLKSGTYLAKYRDAGGQWSTEAATFQQAQESIFDFDTVVGGLQTEEPVWNGAMENVVADGATIRLEAEEVFGEPAEDEIFGEPDADIAFGGAAQGSAIGRYSAEAKMDLGTVQRVRLTSVIDADVVDLEDTIASRIQPITTWPSIIGTVGGDEVDVICNVRWTHDDPAGASPSWSAWERLNSSEFWARGFETELVFRRTSGQYTMIVSSWIREAKTVDIGA